MMQFLHGHAADSALVASSTKGYDRRRVLVGAESARWQRKNFQNRENSSLEASGRSSSTLGF
jgi:hypothetical protein